MPAAASPAEAIEHKNKTVDVPEEARAACSWESISIKDLNEKFLEIPFYLNNICFFALPLQVDHEINFGRRAHSHPRILQPIRVCLISYHKNKNKFR